LCNPQYLFLHFLISIKTTDPFGKNRVQSHVLHTSNELLQDLQTMIISGKYDQCFDV